MALAGEGISASCAQRIAHQPARAKVMPVAATPAKPSATKPSVAFLPSDVPHAFIDLYSFGVDLALVGAYFVVPRE